MMLPRRLLLAAACAAPVAVRAAPLRNLLVPLAFEPDGLIPGLSDQPSCRLVGTKLYQGLVRYTGADASVGELARSWTVSADGLTYRFTLRPGIIWHDGTPFSAADVVFSIDRFHRLMSPRIGSMLARVATVQAVDQDTVDIGLVRPGVALLPLLDAACTPIVPRHIHDRPGFAIDPRRTPSVGTGPYRLAAWLRLTPFPGFAGPPPALDEINFPLMPDPTARIAATRSGQPVLLAADAVPFAALAELRQQGMIVAGLPVPNHASLAWLDLNHAAEPLNDVQVRLALGYAIDRAAVVREVWSGLASVATGPVPGAVPDAPLPPYDPRAAGGQLTAAGLLPDDRGIRLRLRYLSRDREPWPRLGAVLRDALEQVGIELTLDSVDEFEWQRRVQAGDYQLTGMVGEGGEPPSAVARKQMVDDVSQIWLVEPGVPTAADRRLRMPGGVYSTFAEADLNG